jgi:regulator of protease activity HflC (stomatin/prohibitin superfamily)
MNKNGQSVIGIFFMGFFILLIIISIFAVIVPIMKPWWAEQNGKAEYAQADQNRRIAVLEATAKEESAKHLAQAEINRAEGVAQANKIIGESLKNNEDYLKYLWITDVAGANIDKTIVYIPTETNLPILEAGKTVAS